MLKEEIVVGKAYVNEQMCILREVVEEVDNRHVRYHAFELESGRLLPARHRTCSRAELKRWADREAEMNERARIHPFEVDAILADGADLQGALLPEEARTASEAAPGVHTFPRTK